MDIASAMVQCNKQPTTQKYSRTTTRQSAVEFFSQCQPTKYSKYTAGRDKTHIDTGMLGISSQKYADGHGTLIRLASIERIGVGSVKSGGFVKENHVLGLALGVKVGNNFQWRASLHQRHLHVQRTQIDAQNGLGRNESGWEGTNEGQEHLEQ